MAEANNSFWHGRRIRVERKTSRRDVGGPKNNKAMSHPTKTLYIGNIPYETSDADLNRLFRGLENVTDVRVAVDRSTGWPRGFAHADFIDEESCTRAAEKIKETRMGERLLRVDYAAERGRTPAPAE